MKSISNRTNYAIECAKTIRKEWGLSEGRPIVNLFSLVEAKEFLLLKFPNNKGISGGYLEKKIREGNVKCIYINTYEPIGRLNFSLAHELYHAFYEESNDCLSLNSKRSKDVVEKTAEAFASNFLMPKKTLVEQLNRYRVTNNTWLDERILFDIQMFFRVSFQALVYTIDSLTKFQEFKKFVPKNIATFRKYYREPYWKEINNKILKYDPNNNMNSIQPIFEYPKGLKENISNNIKNGIIDENDVADIFKFFKS